MELKTLLHFVKTTKLKHKPAFKLTWWESVLTF